MNEVFKLKQIFPEVKFEVGTLGQLERVIDECKEAKIEFENNNKDALLYELIDVAHCAMTAVYKAGYTHKEINEGLKHVRNKNNIRGYYLK
jgi:phosphoribosyl-ATP pyrophosphohydrolase